MLDQLSQAKAAHTVGRAVIAVIGKVKSMAAGKMGFSTSQVGDMVAAGLSEGFLFASHAQAATASLPSNYVTLFSH
jgi:hypothetical protein